MSNLKSIVLLSLVLSPMSAHAWFLNPSTTGAEFMEIAKKERAAGHTREAIQAYSRASKKPETHFDAQMELGRYYLELGDYRRTIQLFESYMSSEDRWPVEARLALAEAYVSDGQFVPAVRHLDYINTLRPGYLPAAEIRGLVHFHSGRFDDAVLNLSAYLKGTPDSFRARWYRAQSYLKLKNWDSATQDFANLGSRFPQDHDVAHSLARAQLGAGKARDAELTLRTWDNPQASAATFDLLAQALDAQGDTAGATVFGEKAARTEPDSGEYSLHFGKLLMKSNRVRAAATEFARMFWIHPEFDAGVQELVNLHQGLGEFDRAGYYLSIYTKKYPGQTWAALRYVDLLVALLEFREARKVVDRFESASSNDASKLDLALMRSKIQHGLKQPQEALETLYEVETFLRREEKQVQSKDALYYNLAVLEEELGFNDRAVKHYESIPVSHELGVKARINLALMHEKSGHFSYAVAALQELKSGTAEQFAFIQQKLSSLTALTAQRPEGRFQERMPASTAYEFKVIQDPDAYKLPKKFQ